MAEDYIRPPTVALPPPDHRMAVWRFRIVVGSLLLLLVVIIVLVTKAIVHSGDSGGAVGMHPSHAVIASLAATVG